MANRIWSGATDDNFETTTNWSGSTVPVDADSIIFSYGSRSVLTNTDQQTSTDIDPLSLRVGGTYSGSLGTAANPLMLATFDTTNGLLLVDVSGPPDQVLAFNVTSVPRTSVMRTGNGPYACYLKAGTFTTTFIQGGVVRLGSTFSGTTVYVDSGGTGADPVVTIESGAAISGNLHIASGKVKCSAAIAGTVFVEPGAEFEYEGTGSTGNIGALTCGGIAKLWGKGGFTVTTALAFGSGVIDTQRAETGWTFTNATARGRSIIRSRPVIDIFTNAPVEAGGSVETSGTIIKVSQ